MKDFAYIVADPKICSGKPTYKGTRVLVQDIIELISQGKSWMYICANFDGISFEALEETLRLASKIASYHPDEVKAELV